MAVRAVPIKLIADPIRVAPLPINVIASPASSNPIEDRIPPSIERPTPSPDTAAPTFLKESPTIPHCTFAASPTSYCVCLYSIKEASASLTAFSCVL
jgi:hypothetical protein